MKGLVRRAVCLGAVAAVGISACGDDEGDGAAGSSRGEPYIVGVTGDSTGPTGSFFAAPQEGLQLFFENLNANDGIDGHPVEVRVEDNRSVPTTAAAQARSLIADGAHVVGVSAASVTINAVLGETARAGVPMQTVELPCIRELAIEKVQPTLFCFGVAENDGETMAQLIKSQDRGASVVGVSYDVPSSRAAVDAGLARAKREGLQAGENVVVPLDMSDPGSFAARIMSKNPDWVLAYGTWEHTAGPIFEALRRRGWEGKYLFSGVNAVEANIAKLKDPGFYSANWATMTVDSNPQIEALTSAAEKFSAEAEPSQMTYGWMMGLILAQAFRDCGWPCDPKDMPKALEGVSVETEGFTGAPLAYSEDVHAPVLPLKMYHWDEQEKGIVAVGDWVGGPDGN